MSLCSMQHVVDTKPEYIKLSVERSSLLFVKEHESQFDWNLSKPSRNGACGLPMDAGMTNSEVAKGKSG
jgi:hypothetical protein